MYDDVLNKLSTQFYKLKCIDFSLKEIQMHQNFEISESAQTYIETRKRIKLKLQEIKEIMVELGLCAKDCKELPGGYGNPVREN